ncbi:MAG TPA: SusC/RagA family TonB-linked outer membrane protein [Lacibacter sp.]|nr:SusC/RagA family TonB-linked outer membrane protein [Lacibacter sp.]
MLQGEVVSSGDQQPLSGMSVRLLGTAKGTTTSSEGKFSLNLTTEELQSGSIEISGIGFKTRQLRIAGRTSLRIVLSPSLNEMGEVVVSGYSRPKPKEEVVGSLSVITNRELQTIRPIESFDKMLEGMVAGVQVEGNSELGTPVKINIRGQNSLTPLITSNRTALTTSSQPLFIIDGVPIIEQRRGDEPIAFLNNEELLNPLAGINPDDIESITVLKDAAAAAIYGANASNGVIIITTKKGKAGKARINAGYSSGNSIPINRIKWLNGPQYHELLKELYINEGRAPFEAELLAGSSTMDTDWFGLTNRYGRFQNIDLDISGGTEALQYRFSTSYLAQDAIQIGNDFKKAYMRLRIDHQLNKKLSLAVTMAPTITMKNSVNVYGIVPMVPNLPVFEADGSFFEPKIQVPNPLAVIDQNLNYHEGGTMNGNVRLDYALLKNLRFSTSFGIDALINKLNIFESGQNATGRSKGGFAQIYDRTNFAWINFNQLNWSPQINDKNQLDFTAGFELQSQMSKLLRGTGTGFSYYRLNELSNASNQTSASSRQTNNSYSVYSQASYNFNKKYFANISGRLDAASVFGTDVNSTVNGALGLGWTVSNERFLQQVKWMDLLRTRISFGTTGNSRIGSYEAKGLYEFGNDGYNGLTTAYPSTPPNPGLSWEKSYKLNTGIDLNIVKRFSLTVDFYQNIIDDAISLITVPVVNGFESLLENTAKMRNRGFDFTLRTDNIRNPGFTWNSVLTFGFNRNVVLEVKNNAQRFSVSENAAVIRTNVSTGSIWGFRQAGVDPQTGVELFYDNTGKVVPVTQLDISMRNAYSIGDRLPRFQGGLVNTFSYKGFNLTVNLLYSVGGHRLINYRNEWNGRNLDNRNQGVNLLDRWRQPGDIATIPRLSRTTRFVVNSSRFVYEDTYLKLSNITLGYALPKKWSDQIRGIRISVFANGTNLLYWYKEKSPPGRNGLREYKYNFPEAQTWTWGIKASF